MKSTRDPMRMSAEPGLEALFESRALDDDALALERVALRLAAVGAISAAAASATTLASGAASGSGGAASAAAAGTGASSAGAAATLSMSAALAAKVTLVVVALVTIASVATFALRQSPTDGPPPAASPSEPSRARGAEPSDEPPPVVELPSSEPETTSTAPSPHERVEAPRRRTPERAAPTLAEEMALVARMRESVDSDPQETLRLAAEHRERFGESGRFVRDCERYEALARAALTEEAPASE